MYRPAVELVSESCGLLRCWLLTKSAKELGKECVSQLYGSVG